MIPDEAIEAAAEALVSSTLGDRSGINWEEFFEAARLALNAATPYMQRISAEDISAVADMIKAARANGWDEGYEKGLERGAWEAAPVTTEPMHTNPYGSQP